MAEAAGDGELAEPGRIILCGVNIVGYGRKTSAHGHSPGTDVGFQYLDAGRTRAACEQRAGEGEQCAENRGQPQRRQARGRMPAFHSGELLHMLFRRLAVSAFLTLPPLSIKTLSKPGPFAFT